MSAVDEEYTITDVLATEALAAFAASGDGHVSVPRPIAQAAITP
jgi:hypothetical protein